MKSFKLITILLFLKSPILAQSDYMNYYPMHIGDERLYQEIYYDFFKEETLQVRTIFEKITGDTLLNDGNRYYSYYRLYNNFESTIFRRIDTTSKTLVEFSHCENLNLNPNPDSVWIDLCGQENYVGYDTSAVNRLEIIRPQIVHYQGFGVFERRLAKGLGLTYREEGDLGLHSLIYLIHAKIDCTTYDIPTSLYRSKFEVSNSIRLYQNYPNPFNSITQIELFIPEDDFASLKIYNSIGQIVDNLHEGRIKPGNHIFFWDANGFPSGLYYYQIKTRQYSQSKKLLLIK